MTARFESDGFEGIPEELRGKIDLSVRQSNALMERIFGDPSFLDGPLDTAAVRRTFATADWSVVDIADMEENTEELNGLLDEIYGSSKWSEFHGMVRQMYAEHPYVASMGWQEQQLLFSDMLADSDVAMAKVDPCTKACKWDAFWASMSIISISIILDIGCASIAFATFGLATSVSVACRSAVLAWGISESAQIASDYDKCIADCKNLPTSPNVGATWYGDDKSF